MKRWKNYGLWVAVASLIGMVLQDAGVPIAPDAWERYVDAALSIAILAGIISNPSIGSGFKDNE